MRYKTLKDLYKKLSVAAIIMGILGLAAKIEILTTSQYATLEPYEIVIMVIIGILLIAFAGYCFSGDFLRMRYKKNGEHFEGYIESAREEYYARGDNRYFLKISFMDGGKKYRITEAYIGSPRDKLVSRKCSVYKLDGKYLEMDFQVNKDKKARNVVKIPIKYK